MIDAAYTFFFVAVLLGGASFLHLSIRHERERICAALRGEQPEVEVLVLPPTAGQVVAWERPQPILKPVEISICRI